jgi:hypothetical protein
MTSTFSSEDVGVILQTIYDIQARIKELEADQASAKAALEDLYASGLLDELGWMDDDSRINCTEFSATRQVRKVWSYSPAIADLKASLKAAESAEQKNGTATASPGAVSWVFRTNKEQA